jgi:cardiolipin synthase
MTDISNINANSAENKIFTVPNVISFIRLCMVPAFIYMLLHGNNISATVLFALAAATDCLDGQIARRTNQVSKLGKILDPAVDTILMVSGALSLILVQRLPIWIGVIILIREVFLLTGGGILLSKYSIRVPVVYPGKAATTFLFTGFAMLLLNWPILPSTSTSTFMWMPGFGSAGVCLGIYVVLIGFILQISVTIYYCVVAWSMLKAALNKQ